MQTLDRNALNIFHSPELCVNFKTKPCKTYTIEVNGSLLLSTPILYLDHLPFNYGEYSLFIKCVTITKIANNAIRIVQNANKKTRETFYAKTNVATENLCDTLDLCDTLPKPVLQVHDDILNIDLFKIYPCNNRIQIINDTNELLTVGKGIRLSNRILLEVEYLEKEKDLCSYFCYIQDIKAVRLTKPTPECYKLEISFVSEKSPVQGYIDSSKVVKLENEHTGYLLEKYLPVGVNIQKIASCLTKNKYDLLYISNPNKDEKQPVIFDPDLSHIFYNSHGAAILSKKENDYLRYRYITPNSFVQKRVAVHKGPTPVPQKFFRIHEEAGGFKINYRPAHLITILKADEPCPETIQEANFEKVSENLNWLTDILGGVFKNLSEEERVFSSRVCKQWHFSLKKVDGEAMNSIVRLVKRRNWQKVKSQERGLSFVIW